MNIKKLLKITIVCSSLSIMASGCYYDKFEELHPGLNTGCDSAIAGWNVQVSKIITTYCFACHNGATASGGILLDNYSNVKAQATSGMLMNALNGTGVPSMPPNTHLDDCKIGSIKHWINGGMLNN